MTRFLFCIVAILSGLTYSKAQGIEDSIPAGMLEETVSFLASNKLKGRVNHSREQLEAAAYLKDQFSGYGLRPFPGFSSLYLPFYNGQEREKKPVRLTVNGKDLDDSLWYFFSASPVPEPAETADFFILQVFYPANDSLLFRYWDHPEKVLVWIILDDTVHFSKATEKLVIPPGMPAADILLMGARAEPSGLKIIPEKKLPRTVLYNIIGVLPGRMRPEEAVLFSAHYDHVDVGLDAVTGEIFNGANDNASGTAAVLALARYFAMRKDNERTLVFCLFAGEELGLLGSRAFTGLVNPSTIKAVINIEMIGMINASGKNAFMITGPSYSTLAEILQKNLSGEAFRLIPIKADTQRLFERSDNFPFYEEGVPAHTLMCSDDEEPCYHKPCDDTRRIDFRNMARVVQAIAQSCRTIISGEDTPVMKK